MSCHETEELDQALKAYQTLLETRTMEPKNLKRIDEMLDSAVRSQRGPFLRQLCADDPGVRQRIEGLLEAYDKAKVSWRAQ